MQKMASEDITHITPTQVRFQNNKSVESFQNFSFVNQGFNIKSVQSDGFKLNGKKNLVLYKTLNLCNLKQYGILEGNGRLDPIGEITSKTLMFW